MKVNGKDVQISESISLECYILSCNYARINIAVELNGYIVPKEKYPSVMLKDEDSMEIVTFVGGG
jgi:thiamine biosynthesis protein ThiS